ncbi:MAG: zinc finger HIT domain-containing protein, partial [archaeon]|nr:zinc finger HIT domain-containing protein [archaeon]
MEDNISLKTLVLNPPQEEEEEEDTNTAPKEVAKCQICKQNEYKYVCPKCKVLYCSINCYKNHSSECTEEFYKDHVIKELKATKMNKKDVSKFKLSLKDYYSKLNEDE